jgi:hypothetical protein
MIFRIFTVFLFLFLTNLSFSQTDSTSIEKDTLHSVRKATILSAVLPGAGQIYNHFAQPKGKKKAFWKVPLIYGALGFAGYSIIANHSDVLSLRKEYRYREANSGSMSDWLNYNDQGILLLEQQKASQRDYSILGFVLVYALQVADAAVEAHFVSFDISEDLSLSIKPWTYRTSHTGLSLSFNFR